MRRNTDDLQYKQCGWRNSLKKKKRENGREWIPAISPGAAERILDEWIDLIPANKVFAVGGDSNYVEGAFGHCLRARRAVCAVLGGRVAAGTLSLKDAKWLAGRLLGENARDFFRL